MSRRAPCGRNGNAPALDYWSNENDSCGYAQKAQRTILTNLFATEFHKLPPVFSGVCIIVFALAIITIAPKPSPCVDQSSLNCKRATTRVAEGAELVLSTMLTNKLQRHLPHGIGGCGNGWQIRNRLDRKRAAGNGNNANGSEAKHR